MPRRLLSFDHVQRELRRRKCRPIKEYETTTIWETASGIHFSVPYETYEKRTDEDALREIILDIEKWNLFSGTKRPKPSG